MSNFNIKSTKTPSKVSETGFSDVILLKSKFNILEKKYKTEVENNTNLRKLIEHLNEDIEKLKSTQNVSENVNMMKSKLEAQSKLQCDLISTSAAIMENKINTVKDLKDTIALQEEEIERLKIYKKDFFELKRKCLELELNAEPVSKSSVDEKKVKKEMQEAKERENKLKKKMLKNFEEKEKTLQKMNEKMFEMERKIKDVAIKQIMAEKIIEDFKQVRDKFKKIVRFCFYRFDELNESIVNISRTIYLKSKERAEQRQELLVDFSSDYNNLETKLEEYHEILQNISKMADVNFNSQSLTEIYRSLKARKAFTDKFKRFYEKLKKKEMSDSEFLDFLETITEVGLHDNKTTSGLVVHISLD